MGRLILHLGVGKTGTTSLQENLFDRLSNCVNLGRPNHQTSCYRNFCDGILSAEDKDVEQHVGPFVDLVEKQVKTQPLTIISEENLQAKNIYSYSLARLKSCFPDAHILVTVRNQLTAIQSYYAYTGYRLVGVPAMDEFNRKKQISFNEFLSYCLDNVQKSYFYSLKYGTFASVIEKHYAKDKINFLLYEEMLGQTSAFLTRLAHLFQRDVEELQALWEQGKPKNTRQSARYLRYLALRTKIPVKSIGRYLPVLKWLSPSIEKLLKKSKSAASEYSEHQLQKLRELYAEENSYLQQQYQLDLGRWNYLLDS